MTGMEKRFVDDSPRHDRRRFLSSIGGGFGLFAWHALQQLELQAATLPSSMDPLRPTAPRTPQFAPQAKSVIFLFLVGGPSHIDSFDFKPELQKLNGQPVPKSIRQAVESTRHANVFHGCEDKLMASPFSFSRHGEMGIHISQLWPNLAKQVDRLCFIHSLQAESNNHAPASYQLHTGEIRPGKASLGSWVTYGLGSENENLPGYVVLFDAGPLGGAANYSNGFLPPAFQPTRLQETGPLVRNLTPPSQFADGQRASLDLLRELNLQHRAPRDGNPELDARIASYELAYRMQSAGLEVANFSDETVSTTSAYGLNHTDDRTAKFGRKCLLARRLVERGVRFVQLYDMPDKDGWDAHSQLTKNHVPRARWTDQPMAALVADLQQRGLLDSTIVLCASEFGRTPMMQGDKGRQHNAAGFTIWLAGGNIPPGRIGATDELGLMAVERPLAFRDLHATLLSLLGLDYEALGFETSGRFERLTGVAGSASLIDEIM